MRVERQTGRHGQERFETWGETCWIGAPGFACRAAPKMWSKVTKEAGPQEAETNLKHIRQNIWINVIKSRKYRVTPTLLSFCPLQKTPSAEKSHDSTAVWHMACIYHLFLRLCSPTDTKKTLPFTFLGKMAAPKSGKTVAPPASTSLIWKQTNTLYAPDEMRSGSQRCTKIYTTRRQVSIMKKQWSQN